METSSVANIWSTLEGEVVDGKYHLRRVINSGAFGCVFEADEAVADKPIRQVAIKLITPDTEHAGRQFQELALAVSFDHPGLLRCFSAGQCIVSDIMALYIVMELAGASIAAEIIDGPLPPEKVKAVLESVLGALIYLGERDNPLVHRDVKPDNVLLVGNRWKLADFGMLQEIGPRRVARTAAPVGTPKYAPPEAFGGVVSQAWDMWSVGVMLVEMMTGEVPYHAQSQEDLHALLLTETPRHVQDLPEPFRSVASQCLVVQRARRLTAEKALGMLHGSSL